MATFDLFRKTSLSENKQFYRNNSNDTISRICIKNGMLTSVLLIMFFVAFCASTHHLEITQLSIANLLLLLFGVYFALENVSSNSKGASIDYFEGFKVGLYTSAVAVGLHALFILAYTSFDASILSAIKEGAIWKLNLNPLTIAGCTLFEGLSSGLIITYCLMQYFKKN